MDGGGWRYGHRLHDLEGGQMSDIILSLVTFLPALGAVLIAVMPRNDRVIRWAALILSLATFGFSIYLPLHLQTGQAGQFQFEVSRPWIGQHIFYHLASDRISTRLALLTRVLAPLSRPVAWKSRRDRVEECF